MKNIILIVLSVFSFSVCAQNEVETKKESDTKKENVSTMVFESGSTIHDFGDILANKAVECVFKFTNNGDTPIIVSSASSSCGCTVPEIPKEPVLSGKTGEVKVTFNGVGSGKFHKNVILITNLPNPRVTLGVTGNILTQKQLDEKQTK